MNPIAVMELLTLLEKVNLIAPEAGLTEAELEAIKVKTKADIAAEISV